MSVFIGSYCVCVCVCVQVIGTVVVYMYGETVVQCSSTRDPVNVRVTTWVPVGFQMVVARYSIEVSAPTVFRQRCDVPQDAARPLQAAGRPQPRCRRWRGPEQRRRGEMR